MWHLLLVQSVDVHVEVLRDYVFHLLLVNTHSYNELCK